MQQIKSFGVLQTAKVSGVLYLIVSAIFAIPFAVIGAVGGSRVREARGSTYAVIDFGSSSLRGYGCPFCGVSLFGVQLGSCKDRRVRN